MSYQVGVDVGGSFTTAAVVRGGRAGVVKVVPSRLPGVPRGFLNRVGDDTPVLVGNRPVPAEILVAQLVSQVLSGISRPDRLAVTYPVTWGPHRVAALRSALGEVTMLSTSAAVAFRGQAPTAVHDLGGTTFTSAVVRGLATVGQPTALDLGGADLDELVFDHVRATLGDAWRDERDTAALARLRQACTRAKETLSSDTEVEIPVALHGLDTRVRLTRAEFEEMAQPLLAETAAAFRMTIEESGVVPATVLLAGGAAWLPLLTQVVSAELGRPVTATPPGAAAMGAALAAGDAPSATPIVTPGFAPPPTRLAMSLEPVGEPRTSLVEPTRPPVPASAAPVTEKPRRQRTMLTVAAAGIALAGAAVWIALTMGQQPPGAGAEPLPPTTTVTSTVEVTTTEAAPPPPERQTPRQQTPQRQTSRPQPSTSTTTARPTTTTTTATTTTRATSTPAEASTPETAEGGER